MRTTSKACGVLQLVGNAPWNVGICERWSNRKSFYCGFLFFFHSHFLCTIFVFKSAFNTIWFCCIVQGLACFHRAHRTVFQNQQSVSYVSGLERTLSIWDKIEGSTCCGILQNGTHYTLWRVLLNWWRAEYRLEQILVYRIRYQAHTISLMWAM